MPRISIDEVQALIARVINIDGITRTITRENQRLKRKIRRLEAKVRKLKQELKEAGEKNSATGTVGKGEEAHHAS
ncbi:hypothetical protein MMC14_002851 [Varicellaria rhodocarpa]|nr:hypothetical protein [Varicellaria rhodocarpa]